MCIPGMFLIMTKDLKGFNTKKVLKKGEVHQILFICQDPDYTSFTTFVGVNSLFSTIQVEEHTDFWLPIDT